MRAGAATKKGKKKKLRERSEKKKKYSDHSEWPVVNALDAFASCDAVREK